MEQGGIDQDQAHVPAGGRAGQADRLTKAMSWIPGGTFRMGSADFYPEERPVHRVTVDGFWMDRSSGDGGDVPAVRQGDRIP